ncbi:MAG TPA: acyl-CoA dehydrogenase family protein [Acidimicrobiia bacterium]|nr:acyl-CoA dehydrogenase family protein [Acidimicrobiia bacterium]
MTPPSESGATTATTERDAFVPRAREIGERIAPFSAGHDRDGSFVHEAYEVFRETGYLALAVPTELGGAGATIAQVTAAQAELARHCASSALAVSMHLHITLFAAWRYRRELPGAEGLLRRVADEQIVLVSTGGSDFTRPNGTAVKVDGGFTVNGRKIFASQVPVGDVFSTMFTYDDPDQGKRALVMGVPVRQDGIEVLDTWDTMGMRGTGSHDVQITDVFVPDAAVSADRPWGVIDPPLMGIVAHAIPVISGVYLGIAEGARDRALTMLRDTPKATDPVVQRLAGLVDYRTRAARWALFSAIAEIGDDPAPSMDNVVLAMQAKRVVAEEAVAACDAILQLVGGAAYFRSAGFEQALRDIRGVQFHPLTPELTLLHAGRVALGQPADEM